MFPDDRLGQEISFMRKIFIIACVVCLSGCMQTGPQYNFEMISIDIPIKATGQELLVLVVEDFRPYVLSGNEKPSFLGITRDAIYFGYYVYNASGKPITEIMSAAIENGLKDVGFTVVSVSGNNNDIYLVNAATKNNASRIVVLKVLEWKIDVWAGVATLHSNLNLSVFDAKGELLAESNNESMGNLSIDRWVPVLAVEISRAMADEFSKRIGDLFGEDQVRRALQ